MDARVWDVLVGLVTVGVPLVGAPLTVLLFHLRSLRGDVTLRLGQMERRLEEFAAESRETRRQVSAVQRDYTTKEEWLRESMMARQALERNGDSLARLEARVEGLDAALLRQERQSRILLAAAGRMAGGRLGVPSCGTVDDNGLGGGK